MRILIIRHGEPDYSSDTLTPKGRKEAELLSRRLNSKTISDIFVSPLGRAKETAEYTLKLLGKKAEVMPWLAEFRGRYPCSDGKGNTIPWDFRPRYWTRFPELMDPDAWADCSEFMGGTVRKIWDETKTGVDELLARYGFRKDGPVWQCEGNEDRTIVLFCHFGIGMAVAAYLMNVSPVLFWQTHFMAPSSVTEVVTEERVPGEAAFRFVRVGDQTHLEGNGEPWSTFGLFPMSWSGVDATDPTVNNAPRTVW